MMRHQTAIYARVSSERQAEEDTIASQLSALRERVAADGLDLPEQTVFVDDGYSGSTLVRPALERLRDLAAMGGVDWLYVHSPDRLARKYAYQALLVEELEDAGVEVVFLNRRLGGSPEDELLLQVQGMVAEYERAKLMERSRRGKRHAAHSGSVSVLAHAPYGYRYVTKAEGGGQASYEIVFEEARMVRQIFEWVGIEGATLGEVSRRLQSSGAKTRTGRSVWDRSVVWGMLGNPAYVGRAVFGRTRRGPYRPEHPRAKRGHSGQPRNAATPIPMPEDEWITVPVPAIVDEALFEAVQEQLQQNRLHARERRSGAKHLLSGLLVCARCEHAYYGLRKRQRNSQGELHEYGYYRCIGSDAYRFGGEKRCHNEPVYAQAIEEAVWQEACALLEEPARLEEEYRRRSEDAGRQEAGSIGRASLDKQLARSKKGLARLIDGYAEGLIEKEEFVPRAERMRRRVAALEEQLEQQRAAEEARDELRLIVGRIEEFAAKVRANLEEADYAMRREILQALVKRVEVDQETVNVVFKAAPPPGFSPPDPDLEEEDSQHRRKRVGRALRESGPGD